jgi:predicted transcriptional regulator
MTETSSQPRALQLTAQIVAAHASHNHVTTEVLLGLIGSVYGALAATGQAAVQEVRPQPAVPVKRSVFPSYVVCLEDGKKLKMLKRHLMTSYGMTPDQYRAKWDLPASYPMVAPDYAAQRSTLAKQIGLGRKLVVPAASAGAAGTAAPRARRGRPPATAAAAE